MVIKLTQFNKYLSYVENVFLSIVVALMAIILVMTTASRLLGIPFASGEELAGIFLVSSTYIGSAAAVRKSKHIRMVAISEICSFRITRAVTMINLLVAAICFFALGGMCGEYLMFSKASGRVFKSLPFGMWLVWIPVVLGMFLTSIQYIITFMLNIVEWKKIQTKEMIWIGSERRFGDPEE